LSESLSFRSYRGGVKVAVIAPAEAMSLKAFNALLKTLEEPADDTFLVLAASRVDRIPKTIMSRTMRLRLPLPGETEALTWLRQQKPDEDWPALLALAGGAPFLAADCAAAGLGELDAEMQEAIAAAVAGRLDVVAFADACAKNAPSARLVWLESWLTRSLREAALASDLVNNNRLPWLRPPGLETKIRAGYGLLDELRDARRLVGGALNTQLLFEGLTVSLAALVGRPAS
jgi:DNA polymerase-3 subunit delta'